MPNAAWTPIFYGAQAPLAALIVISLLFVALVITLGHFWKIRNLAGTLLVPYVLWISTAIALNGSIWLLN